MNDLRGKAKDLCSQKRFNDAVVLYQKIWEHEDKEHIDKWLAWEYATTLKKNNELDKCIEVALLNNKQNPDFRYNNNLLGWALYARYIKPFKNNDSNIPLSEFIKKASFITEITKQEKTSAFELTVIYVLKVLKGENNTSPRKVLEWIDKLDEEKTNCEIYPYVSSDGKSGEIASNLEFYYSFKTKALFDIKDYENCIIACDMALRKITAFHYDNDIWFKLRKYRSYGMLGHQEEAAEQLIKLAVYKKHWILFSIIAELFYMIKEYKTALLYACKACATTDPPKMKVNLYIELGKILEALNNELWALKHYVFSKIVREQNQWGIPSYIEERIPALNLDFNLQQVELTELQDFWQEIIIESQPRYSGTVKTILPNGNGFVSSPSGSYYFKTSSLVNRKIRLNIGTKVEFSLTDSYDKKKQKESKEAVNIIIQN